MARILLIDDDRNLREVVTFILAENGHEVLEAADGDAGVQLFTSEAPDLVLTDIRMPGRDGMEVLRYVRAHSTSADVPVIVLTAYGTVEQAVEAMREGAYTYLLKPFNRDELALTVQQALQLRTLARDNRNLRRLLRERGAELPLVYASQAMVHLVDQVRRVAGSDATVLITGESGTGKELIARALHDLSPRWDAPFIAVNCGAIPADLVESELFGHARGAFTGASLARQGRVRAAAGGTLFLDEIGEFPLSLQPKLLRVLETKRVDPVGESGSIPVDFRLVCATNKDLVQEVQSGRFREDLYYRLEVVRLDIPPLRERPEDIPVLWQHYTRLHGGEDIRTAPELLRRLAELPWRGNVRELINLAQRMVLMRQGDTLEHGDLEAAGSVTPTLAPTPTPMVSSSRLTEASPVAATAAAQAEKLPIGPLPAEGFSLPELECEVIRRALAKCGGNKSRTAAYLGIPRHVLLYRLQKYGL